MYKIPKVNLKWDNLYVYYLHSFKHLCGLFYVNWFENRIIFALGNLATLSKHASWYLNRGPGDNHMTFFSSKQKSTFMIYGGFLYYYIILLYYYLYSEMNKGKSEALQNKQKKVQIYHQIYHLSPPPRSLANKMSTIQPNNSRYFSVQFSLGKFWLKFSSLCCLW